MTGAIPWRTRVRTLLALLLLPLSPLVAVAGGTAFFGAVFWVLLRIDHGEIPLGTWFPFAVGFLFAATFQGTTLVRAVWRGRERSVTGQETLPGEGPLRTTVDRLATQADLSAPEVLVARTETPEAFTVRDVDGRATIVVSEGLVRTLDDRELRAVLAHELAHLRDRDVTVMEWATVPLAVTDVMAEMTDDERYPLGKTLMRVLLGRYAAACAAVVAAGREYGADAGAAELTGDPDALASALATLDDAVADQPATDLRERSDLAALNVVPAGSGGRVSTHPPTEKRIERLQAMETV